MKHQHYKTLKYSIFNFQNVQTEEHFFNLLLLIPKVITKRRQLIKTNIAQHLFSFIYTQLHTLFS